MKKVLISLLTLILIMSMSVSVLAATTGKITLTLNTTNIKPGSEFSITLSASDTYNLNTIEYTEITVTDTNGNNVTGITVKQISPKDDWGFNEEDSSKFYLYTGGEKLKNTEIFDAVFEVSNSVSAGVYHVNFEGLKVYNTNLNDDTTNVGSKTLTITIVIPKIEFSNLVVKEGKYVKVSLGTTNTQITANINQEKLYGEEIEYTNLKDSNTVKTGSKITLGGEEKFTVVVIGDLNKDGLIKFDDIRMMNSIRIEKQESTIAKEILFAGDYDDNGEILVSDIIRINSMR